MSLCTLLAGIAVKKGYLLTGHNTASTAEIFALGTLSYPEIIRIGSPTAGIFSELLLKELPNGWEFSLCPINLNYCP